MYYRQKGQRNPTRPQAIHENFDLCAEALGQRLISYRKQSEEYHNSCIQGELKNKKEKLKLFVAFSWLHWPNGLQDNKMSKKNKRRNNSVKISWSWVTSFSTV